MKVDLQHPLEHFVIHGETQIKVRHGTCKHTFKQSISKLGLDFEQFCNFETDSCNFAIETTKADANTSDDVSEEDAADRRNPGELNDFVDDEGSDQQLYPVTDQLEEPIATTKDFANVAAKEEDQVVSQTMVEASTTQTQMIQTAIEVKDSAQQIIHSPIHEMAVVETSYEYGNIPLHILQEQLEDSDGLDDIH